MMMKYSMLYILASLGSFLGWFALGFEIWNAAYSKNSWLGGFWHLIGYFTIWSNIAVALILTSFSFKLNFTKVLNNATCEFIAVTSILFVGLVYLFLIRGIENLSGLALIVNTILHCIIPILFFIYWILRPHGKLIYLDICRATAFPLTYCVYAFVRGAFTGWYPYFFIDLNKLSIIEIAFIVLGLYIAFIVIVVFLLSFDRFLAKQWE